MVRPSPPDLQNDGVAHVIVLQRSQDTLCSLLLTIFDYTTAEWVAVTQLAITMHEHVFLEHLIHSLGRTQQCLLAGHDQVCHAWHEAQMLRLGAPWPGRDGFGIVMTFTHRQDGTSLLQLGHSVRRSTYIDRAEAQEVTVSTGTPTCMPPDDSERLTRGLVAHDHGPESRRHINLASLLSSDGTAIAVRLQPGHPELQVPTFLEIPPEAGESEVENALLQWGLDCHVLKFGNHDRYLCFQRGFQFATKQCHHMFVNEDETDVEGCILHSQCEEMTHLDIMKFLDELGYARAVVLDIQSKQLDLQCVTFCNSMPQPPVKEVNSKPRTPWPARGISHWQEGQLFHLQENASQQGSQQICTGFDIRDVAELVAAGNSFLQADFSGLDLPDYISSCLLPATPGQTYDRWLIFTDGSSLATSRRMEPQQADEMGQSDTWAMLVLGEVFQEDGSSAIEALGWCAHPVRYDDQGASFTHARHIGAEVAERQALIWAGIWRLMQNSLTPTVFCCDSKTCGQQAFGSMGTANPDESYRLLRGVFQCLEHGLPPGHLLLHHVYSHTGDPYNEFVDTAAKLEMTKSFNHAWPTINMQKWNKIFPHLWLLFGEACGLPRWINGTMDVSTPNLPEPMTLPSARIAKVTTLQCTLSLASANVLSISRNPEGHAGKLHYLFAQMKELGINILGIQEGRAEEGVTSSNQILRFMAGHDRGQGGVEIWINLDQPYGRDSSGKDIYFKEHQFQVVHRDSRRLLVNLQAEGLQCFLLAAHAPHSGRMREERETWWEETTEILRRLAHPCPCIWLIDANAEPGVADGEVVYKKGLRTSANTIFMRTALHSLQMCLPSTWPIHEGPMSTWTAPNGDDQHCIDYIAIPAHWRMSCTLSRTLEDFDLATSREDHKAVSIELTWQSEERKTRRATSKPNVDWSSEETRAHLATAMQEVTCVPWLTDVAKQEQEFSSQINRILRPFCRKSNKGPKKCYIDEKIWQQRSQVLHSRKRLKQIKDSLHREAMYAVFNAWSNRVCDNFDEAFNYGTTLRCCSVHILSRYRAQRFQLRYMLKQAKQSLMQKRLQQVTEHTAATQILRIMKDFTGPTNPRKQKQKTLPLVENQDGQLCTTPHEARQTWIAFFAEMEGGRRQSHQELHSDWISALREEPIEPFALTVQLPP